jgi:hypothetical protein
MNSGFSKYDRKEITQSLNCYPDTDILKNKAGIKDAKALAKFEEDVTGFRQYILGSRKPITSIKQTLINTSKLTRYVFNT